MTASANSALMMGAAPLLTYFFGRFVSPVTSWTIQGWWALCIGLAGLALAILPGSTGFEPQKSWTRDDLLGTLCALGAAAGYALGALISRPLTQNEGAFRVVTVSLCCTAVTLTVAWLFTGGPITARWTTETVAAICLLGVGNTALAYLIYFQLIQMAGATYASLNNYLVPGIGVAVGITALGEDLRVTAAAGLLLIIVSVALLSDRRRKAPT